jgi:hypothetical protein
MPDEWYYIKDKKKLGPVSFAQLRDMVNGGSLQRSDMVLQGGTTKWAAAETVPNLFPVAPGDPPLHIPAPTIQGIMPLEAMPTPEDLEVFAQATEQRIRPHRGNLIFLMGIVGLASGVLGLFAPCCTAIFLSPYPLFLSPFPLLGLVMGVPAWVYGGRDLINMKNHLMDPRGEGQTKTGRLCGLIAAILALAAIAGLVVLMLLYFVGVLFRPVGKE